MASEAETSGTFLRKTRINLRAENEDDDNYEVTFAYDVPTKVSSRRVCLSGSVNESSRQRGNASPRLLIHLSPGAEWDAVHRRGSRDRASEKSASLYYKSPPSLVSKTQQIKPVECH